MQAEEKNSKYRKENNLQYMDFIALHASSTRLSFDDWIRSGTFLVQMSQSRMAS